jgi:hypothetical protein
MVNSFFALLKNLQDVLGKKHIYKLLIKVSTLMQRPSCRNLIHPLDCFALRNALNSRAQDIWLAGDVEAKKLPDGEVTGNRRETMVVGKLLPSRHVADYII